MSETTTCGTIGCKSKAECKISYNFQGEDEVTTDLACGPCADGYSRRPVLKNFKRVPLAPNPGSADVTEYYDIRQEGHKEAWDTTPGATPEDWDKALEIAQERASSRGRNYVVRHVSRQRALLIVTATPEDGLVWPKVGAPPISPAELEEPAKETE